jgi:hypothetical protein
MPQLYLSTGFAAGDECSSTYEGRYVTLEESYLIHPYHADGFVNKGDPVIVGDILVGVALSSAAAATDLIAIDTEGIFYLNVLGCVSDGTSDGVALALNPGDPVFFELLTAGNAATTVGYLSGQADPSHFRPFGFVLGDVSASTTVVTLVAVKVHNDAVADGGRLNFGSGNSTNHVMLLEGDTALRRSVMIRSSCAPETILLAGEQIHGMNIRMEDNLVATGGEMTAGEFKVVRNDDTDVSVSAVTALKLDCDNQDGGIAPYIRGLDIKVEGAGAAPAKRSAIHVGSSGTPGTLESLLELDAFTVCGGVASDTLNTPSGTIAVNVAGVIHYLQLYST